MAETESKKPPKVELSEVATTGDGRDMTKRYAGELELPEDSVLAAKGSGLELYEEVLRDDQVFSTFHQRRSALIACDWDVEPGGTDRASQMAAAQLKELLEAIPFDRISDKMLYGLFYGYAIGECLWVRDGAHIALETIKVRRARRFRFDRAGDLRLITRDNRNPGELMPARKFWTFQSGGDNDDLPYGLGLGHYCYWPAYFKRHGVKFWTIFLDKVGVPTSKGTYPRGASEQDVNKLLAALAAIKSDSGVAIPEGMMIEFMNANTSGAVDHIALPDFMNGAISKVVLGQTMTTDDGASLAQGRVHMDVRDDIVKADADLLCASFNRGPSRWLTEWNFPGARPPRVWRNAEPPEDLDARAARDVKIYTLGYRPTAAYITETYGEGWELDLTRQAPKGGEAEIEDADGEDQSRAEGGALAAFAEPDRDAIGEAVAGLGDEDWEALFSPVMEPLLRRIDGAESLEAVRTELLDALTEMDESQLATRLAQFGFGARLAGRAGVPLTEGDEG